MTIILALAAIPSFRYLYQKQRLQSTAQQLYYVLSFARSEAIKRNSSVYVNFQTSDNWCYGVKPASNCNCSVSNDCTLGSYNASRTQDMTLTATGLTNNSLQYEGTRGATGSSILLTFTSYGQSDAISIKITALGNMQLCSSTISGYPSCT
jgi:type IV fimbrial biogenesis protein FimT